MLFLLRMTLSIGALCQPTSELAAKVFGQYHGEGLSVILMPDGASLHCVFQKLEGLVTREGLWLTSTVESKTGEKFRVMSRAVGREDGMKDLPLLGTVVAAGEVARWVRPGLVEEYSVSVDGVRQDFVIRERPPGVGALALRLAVSGARVAPAAFGAQLVLENSGRKIAYSRLRVTDATGRELSARMEVRTAQLAVVVIDAGAVYPIRIDPTFSDANWISMGGLPGAETFVYAAAVDGSGNLYVGGAFTVIGNVVASRVAKWNGSSWSALGSGLGNSEVLALAVAGNDVYAGGNFVFAGGSFIARWDGTNWSSLGSGVNNIVRSLAVSETNLYAGGDFTTAGGSSATRIARWNGTNWSSLGSGVNNRLNALAVMGTNLYAGGRFTTAGGSNISRIAKWDGSAWSAVGAGVNSEVRALAVSGTDLYAGGDFALATNTGPVAVTVNRIAKWDGNNWSALGSGMNNSVYSLAASGSDVYAGGDFSTAGGTNASRIAKWNGSSWLALGSGTDSRVSALATFGSDVFAAGELTTAGGGAANYVAKWNGSAWAALGSGLNGYVSALAVSGNDLYVGGNFTTTSGVGTNRIARWNGSGWFALGSGMNNEVWALAASGSNVYAGGRFTTAGSSNAFYVARWNGTNWSALGSGMNSFVHALALSGNDLYAAGRFTTAGGSNVNRIAKWNGSNWSALGSGVAGVSDSFSYAYALAVSGSDVYVGGEFLWATNIGGAAVTVNRIARWDGSNWSALGQGMDNIVWALAVSGSNVYAGGEFTKATNAGPVAVTVNRIARWDGSSWSALGSEVNSRVNALVASGNDLYAGGDFFFLTTGGSVASYIAKWDGNSWTNLGSGVGGANLTFPNVNALALSGTDLYAGGRFTTAGAKVSAYIARANLLDLSSFPVLSILRSNLDVIVSWPSPSTGFALEQTAALANPSNWVTNNATVADNGTTKSVTLPATNGALFLRLRNP
jgi:hypothetical protein